MAAEFILTHELTVLYQLKYDREQIIRLSIHHLQMLQDKQFTQRVAYKFSNIPDAARFEPDEIEELDEIEEFDQFNSGKRNLESTGHRDKSDREHASNLKKRRISFGSGNSPVFPD